MMSSAKYLSTRVQRNVDTWAQKGGWKIDVFTSPGSSLLRLPKYLNLDIITYEYVCVSHSVWIFNKLSNHFRLPGVDDNAYPPQKKSFMLLRYMHDYHINDYEWFVRSDDDSYTDFPRLERLLNKLNSSLPIFLGSPGFGMDEDDGIEEGECGMRSVYIYYTQVLEAACMPLSSVKWIDFWRGKHHVSLLVSDINSKSGLYPYRVWTKFWHCRYEILDGRTWNDLQSWFTNSAEASYQVLHSTLVFSSRGYRNWQMCVETHQSNTSCCMGACRLVLSAIW